MPDSSSYRAGFVQQSPSDALSCVVQGSDPTDIAARYLEPICALHDDDWPLPDEVQFAYYAIYNTFEKYATCKAVDDWLIVNQALSCLGESFENFNAVFEATLNKAAK